MRHDRLYDVRWDVIRQTTLGWFTSLDRLDKRIKTSPADLVMSIGILFLMMCERFGLDPREVLVTADRVDRRAQEVAPQYPRGMRQYLREELSDG